MERRSFFKLLLGGGAAALTGLLGVPAVVTGIAPLLGRRKGPQWVPLGHLEEFPPGEVRERVVEVPRDDWSHALRRRAVYVSRPSATAGGTGTGASAGGHEALRVFSRSCTDLGCPVLHDPGSGWFLCPCHGGIFSEDGQPQAGPPSRPLYRYTTRVRRGLVEIDLRSVPPMA